MVILGGLEQKAASDAQQLLTNLIAQLKQGAIDVLDHAEGDLRAILDEYEFTFTFGAKKKS